MSELSASRIAKRVNAAAALRTSSPAVVVGYVERYVFHYKLRDDKTATAPSRMGNNDFLLPSLTSRS